MKTHAHVNDALKSLLGDILAHGATSSPRGKPIRELIGHRVAFDMRFPLVSLKARDLGYRFAPAEAAWILSGDNRVANIERYSKFVWQFSDDGFFYQGAYGPKVVDQLSYVCDTLSDDPATRQAIIGIWRENPRLSRDIPCTLSYQFIVREDKLHVVQSMRSSDAWLGYPYDCFNAAMIATYVMLLLRDRKTRGLKIGGLGTHTMLIGSSHIYDVNAENARKVIESDEVLFVDDEFDPFMFESPAQLITHLQRLAETDIK